MNVGDDVEVQVIHVDPKERRLGLSLRGAEEMKGDETPAAEKAPAYKTHAAEEAPADETPAAEEAPADETPAEAPEEEIPQQE